MKKAKLNWNWTVSALSGIILLATLGQAAADQNFSRLLEQARQGDLNAMCDLGKAYFSGEGTLKDPFKAKCWIKKAYDEGSKKAQKIWQDLELWQYSGNCGSSFDGFDDEPRPRFSGGETFFDPQTNMAFVYLKTGCFMMGCDVSALKCRKEQKPFHKVCVDGFWIAKFEVTQRLWQTVMGQNSSRFSGDGDLPVENVSFEDARQFIRILNSKSDTTYSLPTEAQWEYACKKGRDELRGSEENQDEVIEANCATCVSLNRPGSLSGFYGKTMPVGSFPPNRIGLYDMGGNVKEWCMDIYSNKAFQAHEKTNPVYKGKGSSRVVRGGSFADNASKIRCSSRDKSIPAMRSETIGFRLILLKNKQ